MSGILIDLLNFVGKASLFRYFRHPDESVENLLRDNHYRDGECTARRLNHHRSGQARVRHDGDDRSVRFPPYELLDMPDSCLGCS